MDKNISTLLTDIKKKTGWSGARLAKEVGTSQPTIHRILHGQVDCMGATLVAICDLHQKICAKAMKIFIRRK